MNPTLFVLDGHPVTFAEALAAALAAIALLLLALIVALLALECGPPARGARRRRSASANSRRASPRSPSPARNSTAACGSMSEWLGARQADLARVMSERLDNVGARLGAGLENHAQTTGANLNKLNERLAVIDAAQARMAGMTQEVVSLKDILSNKQTRGAFGQGTDGGDRARRPAAGRL